MGGALSGRVGELCMVGFDGVEATDDLLRFLDERRIGGVILFRRNVESAAQLATLVAALRSVRPDLLVSIDEEGGRVRRLSTDFSTFPSMHLLGRIGSVEVASRLGAAIALELSAVGVNWDFAPVLDVHSEARNPIIGERAISTRAEVVAELGAAFVGGMQQGGVAACGKHFPGHGATLEDSHLTLPVVDRDRDRIEREELLPFRAAVDAGIASLMTAHVLYPALDPERPATLSPTILGGILRDELGFDGVVVTDDLEMRGASDLHGPEELGPASLEAGADLLLVCKERAFAERTIDGVREALASGRLDPSRVARSLERVSALARRFAPSSAPDPALAVEVAGQGRALVAEIESAAASVA